MSDPVALDETLPGYRAIFRHSATLLSGPARSVVVGAQPMVLIEPEIDGSGAMNFVLDVTDLEPLELADLLCVLADSLRADAQPEEPSL